MSFSLSLLSLRSRQADHLDLRDYLLTPLGISMNLSEAGRKDGVLLLTLKNRPPSTSMGN